MKKVSLILTTYNSGENLIKTLESIEKQDYPNIEIVIKDGGSTDQTLDIIKKYQEQSSKTVIWSSKKDTGIYISTGYSAYDCICFIRALLKKYDLSLDDDFVYSARPTKHNEHEEMS